MLQNLHDILFKKCVNDNELTNQITIGPSIVKNKRENGQYKLINKKLKAIRNLEGWIELIGKLNHCSWLVYVSPIWSKTKIAKYYLIMEKYVIDGQIIYNSYIMIEYWMKNMC